MCVKAFQKVDFEDANLRERGLCSCNSQTYSVLVCSLSCIHYSFHVSICYGKSLYYYDNIVPNVALMILCQCLDEPGLAFQRSVGAVYGFDKPEDGMYFGHFRIA